MRALRCLSDYLCLIAARRRRVSLAGTPCRAMAIHASAFAAKVGAGLAMSECASA
jgi:hypothetical protein